MRRDETQFEISNVSWLESEEEPRQPTLTIRASGDTDALAGRLGQGDGEAVPGMAFDVTFRLQGSQTEDVDRGVLAISNRVTGEFYLETNASSAAVTEFVAAARRYEERTEGSARFRTRVVGDDGPVVDFEKRTLLVYAEDGALLRQQSLIPSGVEI